VPAPASLLRQLSGVRVLVVEDDADQREGVVDILTLEGAEVVAARTGDEGFDVFRREHPDVMVFDLWMPSGTGFNFVKRVRALTPEQGGLTPAIAMSAAENMQAALMAGFHAFVRKPYDPFTLVDMIGEFAKRDHGQAVAPWTIEVSGPGKLLLTFVGRVESGDVRLLVAALLVHLEHGAVEVVADLRRLTLFSPSAASVAERAVWHRRDRVRAVRVVGGSFVARLVAAATCKLLGIPCAFSDSIENGGRAEP
jgi:CheY-like chemotaxis protein